MLISEINDFRYFGWIPNARFVLSACLAMLLIAKKLNTSNILLPLCRGELLRTILLSFRVQTPFCGEAFPFCLGQAGLAIVVAGKCALA